MSQDEPTPEDIAGLFRKFGGDAHDYKEFAPPEAEEEAPRAWPLLTGAKIERPAAPAPAPFVVEPVLRPLPPIPAPAPLAAPAPAPSAPLLARTPFAPPRAQPPVAQQPATGNETAPTPLSQLFARLAAPQPPAAPPGPMSRWRRPT